MGSCQPQSTGGTETASTSRPADTSPPPLPAYVRVHTHTHTGMAREELKLQQGAASDSSPVHSGNGSFLTAGMRQRFPKVGGRGVGRKRGNPGSPGSMQGASCTPAPLNGRPEAAAQKLAVQTRDRFYFLASLGLCVFTEGSFRC